MLYSLPITCSLRFHHSFPLLFGSSLRSIPCASVSFTWMPEDHSSSSYFQVPSSPASVTYSLFPMCCIHSHISKAPEPSPPCSAFQSWFPLHNSPTTSLLLVPQIPFFALLIDGLDLQHSHHLAGPGQGSPLTVHYRHPREYPLKDSA